jgi:hypothetical protein
VFQCFSVSAFQKDFATDGGHILTAMVSLRGMPLDCFYPNPWSSLRSQPAVWFFWRGAPSSHGAGSLDTFSAASWHIP